MVDSKRSGPSDSNVSLAEQPEYTDIRVITEESYITMLP